MKVLFVNTNIGYGGASKVMASLANYLNIKKNNVTFLTYRNDKVLQNLHENVVHEHKVLFKHRIKLIERLGEIIVLHRYIKEGNYDVVISFLQPTKFIVVLASQCTQAKVIVSERGDPYTKRKKIDPQRKIIEKVTSLAHSFVFQTTEAQNYYNKKIIDRSKVIPNPVNLKNVKYYNGPRNKEIVNVARLDVFQKRQDVLLKAFSIISNKYDDYVLKLYGDGPDEQLLKNLTHKLGLVDKVRFMGYIDNINSSIQKAAVSVLSSDFEGIPNALIESMSIGVPCISTDCSPGGAKLLIKNNENGLLVPRNSPEDLAVAMDYILSNPNEANRMARKALDSLKQFNEEKIFAQWENFLNEINHCK
jgi:GalNAc-alpha-(1->4)-GalNAc-alpha-(1->3)-diNAcBac-PP-undecaprenol alpha-1,4-N-acetyl-D-galactosaminyltransferase